MPAKVIKPPKYLAFKQTYSGRARELKTNIGIGLPLLLESDMTRKKFFDFIAIWDTGATNTTISEKIVKSLNLQPTGVAQVTTAGGITTVNTYMVDIVLPNKIVIPNVKVNGCSHLNDCDVLIGMDLITLGDFAICNTDGKTHFSFCFPSHKKPVCLFEKSEKANGRR